MSTLEQIERDLISLEAARDTRKGDLQSVLEEECSLESTTLVREKAATVLQTFSDELMSSTVSRIESLVTAGLHDVFGQDHSFSLEVDETRGQQIIRMVTQSGDVSGDVVSTFGGGVVKIEELILRVLGLLKLHLRPILILDESLEHVAAEYVPQAAAFLSSLCREFGIDILMVTHKREFMERADRVYSGSKDGTSLVLSLEE